MTTESKAYIQMLFNKAHNYLGTYLLEVEQSQQMTRLPFTKLKKNLDSPDIFSLLCMCLESYHNLL